MDDPGGPTERTVVRNPGFDDQRRPLADPVTLTVEGAGSDVQRLVPVLGAPLERRSVTELPLDPPE